MAELRKEDLWVMADKLRNNMDSAEYKHVCLGLRPFSKEVTLYAISQAGPGSHSRNH